MIAALVVMSLCPTVVGPLAEVPFKVGDDAIIATLDVNGKTVHTMFDTGFSGSFIIGPHIDLGKPTGKMGLKDFVGVFEANTIKVSSLKMGALTMKHEDSEIVQLPTLDYTESYGTHVDGIMGIEPFLPYVLEINFEHNKFIVYPDTYDFSVNAASVPNAYESKMLPIGMKSIELAVRAPTGKNMVLALDTGNAFYATTHKEVLERVGLWTEGKEPSYIGRAYVASGPVATWNFLMQDARIFGVPVPSSVWSVIDLPSSSAQHDGTVGYGFLKHFNVTIDFKRRKVRLVNFSGSVADEAEGEIGIAATYSRVKKQMVIARVIPDSPAAKAGIREGDLLLSVGDKDLFHSSYREVKSLLDGKKGTTVNIAVSSAGQLVRHALVRVVLANQATGRTD